MQRWSYEVIKIEATGFFVGGNVDEDEIRAEMNRLGREGWELATSVETNANQGASKYILLLFKRPVP